jgi:cytochrome c551/c552
VLSLAVFPLPAGVIKIELPPETASFKPGRGSEIANAQCLICHSIDYVVIQPPSGRAYWDSTVKKMRDKFGAPLPEEQIEPLVNYLAGNYGPETNASPTPIANPASSISVATTGEAVVTKYGCLGCHNVDIKINGPPYKDIALKYRRDPKAGEKISEQIHKGGAGKWGPNLMPPFPMVTDAETKAVTTWILNLQ